MRNIIFGLSIALNVILIISVLALMGALDSVRPETQQPVFGGPACPPVAVTTATPMAFVELVVAVQQIPAGTTILEEALEVRYWPADAAPFTAFNRIEDVEGMIAQTDIVREQPVLSAMVGLSTPEPLACP